MHSRFKTSLLHRKPASGYEIVRVHFKDGQPAGIEPFVTGFLSDGGTTHFARPMGLAVAKDGSLLMADDANGVIYRVAYEGKSVANKQAAPPATSMERQANRGAGVPLALAREEARASAKLSVSSPQIAGKIRQEQSEYYDGVSPELRWSAVSGAKSYALIVEDPDAKPITPFVHWVAWNIPGDATGLHEGLQEQARLTEPEGMLQGATSRGSVGYLGPRPAVGDPPHHYHFQLFALDSMLDVPAGSTRDDVLAAMKGHLVASGEFVGEYQQIVAPTK